MVKQTTLADIPEHLHPFIATQDPSLYTPMDHASWRFIMRLSKVYFSRHAHKKYLDGLEETGLNSEHIPLISEMDAKLQNFGWRAVPVVGFIPPAVFLEFLSLGILPIACDIRTIEHLAYTPAPDIVHEAAGHAPILADRSYASYLLHYGELARKVIFSDKDMSVYEAVRDLSDTKEDPHSTKEQIAMAQKHLDDAISSVNFVSEATELSRMGWWTFEYGLVGTLKKPKIYGAGLLSSIGESYHCLSSKVKKVPMSIRCISTSFDITKPQPQLFVTKDFNSLKKILDQFSKKMAYKVGGLSALEKARNAATVTTTVFESGVQISGKLTEILVDKKKKPIYLRYEGPVQLAHKDTELEDQGTQIHTQGFSTPLGKLKSPKKSPSQLTLKEIQKLNGRLEFESGIILKGRYIGRVTAGTKNLILRFENCTIQKGNQVLFRPEWGVFDLTCGEKVVSVFGGAADRTQYLKSTGGYRQRENRQKTNLTVENKELNDLYLETRKIRETASLEKKQPDTKELSIISEKLRKNYPADWLLRLELLEIDSVFQLNASWVDDLENDLQRISRLSQDKAEMIARGLSLL